MDRAAARRNRVMYRVRESGGSGVVSETVDVDQSATGRATPGTWCCEMELSGAGSVHGVLPATGVHRLARVLVRLHGDPLGYITLPLSAVTVSAEPALRLGWEQFGVAINTHLREEGLPQLEETVPTSRPPSASRNCSAAVCSDELVSVVVCTRDRGAVLPDCLAHLQELTYPHIEVIIVDNAPSDDATRRIVDTLAATDARFRYVCEPRPGLSCARNSGLAAARGTYVAYTDDDVSVDSQWIDGVVRGFQRDADVACVTGLVCSASIMNDAEAYFDARTSSWSTRFQWEVYDLDGKIADDPLAPYSAGVFGTGANFAFERDYLNTLGGFDEALGAGTCTRGGEDLDMFVRILKSGRTIAYEPAAIVWHRHRDDPAALLEQMFGYGTGLSAFLTKCLIQRSTRMGVLRGVRAGLVRLMAIGSTTNARLGEGIQRPKGALTRECAGFAMGPFLYLLAIRAGRRRSTRRSSEP